MNIVLAEMRIRGMLAVGGWDINVFMCEGQEFVKVTVLGESYI